MAKISWRLLVPILLGAVCLVAGETDSSLDTDLILTKWQKEILDEFKERVANKLPHEYMKEEIYLVRWLRARNFDIDRAERMLMKNLKWRKANDMDTILDEDWTDFEKMFPYYIDTFSREGRPMITLNYGRWLDIRSVAVAGKMPQLVRYLTRLFEDLSTKIRTLQENGKNATQAEFLVNLDGFNVLQQACLQCMPIYPIVQSTYENYYPGVVKTYVLFNAPPAFSIVLQAYLPVMSRITKNSYYVIGPNRDRWSKVLLSIADESQLTPEYGGIYIRKEN